MRNPIKKSKLDKIINLFLTEKFEPHKEIFHSESGSTYWIKSNEIIAEIDADGFFWAHKSIYDGLLIAFSLKEPNKSPRKYISNWLHEYHGMKDMMICRADALLSSWALVIVELKNI